MPANILKELSGDILNLHHNTQNLMLATQDESNIPDVSSAPYALINGCYYILLAGSMHHAAHLQRAPQAAILLIEDEAVNHNPFARLQLSWIVMARMIACSETQYGQLAKRLERRFSQTMSWIKNMRNLCLCELRPQQGIFSTGCGKSYALDAHDLWQVLNDSERVTL